MNNLSEPVGRYRAQLSRITQMLTATRPNHPQGDAPEAESENRFHMFTDGNVEKRISKIEDQFSDILDEFGDLGRWLDEYVVQVPLSAYATAVSDSMRFVAWYSESAGCTPQQADCVTCLRSRYEVERAGAANRMQHIRFQELWSAADEFSSELAINSRLWIHLNPIHVWATFHTTTFLDVNDTLPSSALFFPVGSDIRTAIVEPTAAMLVRCLEQQGPSRLRELRCDCDPIDPDALVSHSRDLAEVGLVAFG